MLKGTNASSGIGIGNAVIVEEKELVTNGRLSVTRQQRWSVLRARST